MSEQTLLWGREDDERLTYTDPDEAIEAYIDDYPQDELAEYTVTVCEFRPMKPKYNGARRVVERVLEDLDEDYGDPDGDGSRPTPAMLAAAETFIAAVLAEYRGWSCEPTGERVTVNALEWTKEHRPDWLEPQRPTDSRSEGL